MSSHTDPDDEILAVARAGFLEEAAEMLRQFEQALLGLESDPADHEMLNAAFRAAHTLKGTAGLFGCDRVVGFTHEVETVLERMRSGERTVDEAAIAVLLQSRDQIGDLLAEVDLAVGSPEVDARSTELGHELRRLLDPTLGAADPDGPAGAHAPATAAQPAAGAGWRIQARFGPDALRNGLDPLSFLRYMASRGRLDDMQPRLDAVPTLDALDAEACHLGFEVTYHGPTERAEVEAVFEFAVDDCTLDIQPLPEPGLTLPGSTPPATSVATFPTTSPTIAATELQPAERRASGDRRSTTRDRRADDARFIRVQADKLDKLIDLIGELVIASSGVQLAAQQEDVRACSEAALRMADLVEQARDGALSLRMVPIGETFARFHRIVRDIGKSLGKAVDLQISGGETELDKSMVEVIADPLTHLVRNSLDHGIELPAEREAAGKPAQGTLALHAYHEAGQVVIEVSDDGRGLNRERILAKAVERGLVLPEQILSDAEIDQLICQPGFSTADQVTDLSGRGVGMDVVKRSIEGLRGQMQLSSATGRGTTTQIRLPLTLAIIDGFLTQVGGVSYVLPLEIVAECLDLPDECRRQPDRTSGCFDLRGEVLSYLDLGRFYNLPPMAGARRSLVIVRDGTVRVGLIVDRLLGEHQTVIKPLSPIFRHLRAIAGSTILGSGEVALVLDVPALVAGAIRKRQGVPALATTGAAA